MIIARRLVKTFAGTSVLRELDLRIGRGTIYGLAGRSGAGKSTLLRCINGLETYDAGSLEVGKTDVRSLSGSGLRAFRKNIGMVFQQFSLLERLNVYDNVALPLRCWKYKTAVIDRKVRDLLELVGIPEKVHHKPRELSGGQKQRVAIARALTMDPHLLLCDEATSALDPKTARSIIELLKEINRRIGITIVCVTHQMSVLRSLCDEMAVLEHGRIAVSGSVEGIFRQQPPALRNLLGDGEGESADGREKTLTLLLPDAVAAPLIPHLAVQLGCELVIRAGDGPQKLVVRFPEEDLPGVERYLTAHGIRWSADDLGPGEVPPEAGRVH